MKNLIYKLVVLAFIMVGTISVAKATPETFYVKITLSDTCSPSYHGYYCVRLNLTFNGGTICTATNCNVIPGTYCYSFTCDLPGIASDPLYGVELVIAYRSSGGGNCSTTSGTPSSGFYWYQMTNSSCVATLDNIVL